jgi:anaerobic selenocysteine-containing dehydrogenase
MGVINASRGRLEPAAPTLLSEPAIVCRLARALWGAEGAIPWAEFEGNYDSIRERIARVVPGFADYNRRVRSGPFYLPNPPRDGRVWRTQTGKANFTVAPIPGGVTGPGEYLMMTIRTHDQFNTTVYGLDDRYRGVFGGRRVVFMHEADMAAAGLQQGQLVDLTNRHGGVERVARAFMVAPYRIPRGCVATYFPGGQRAGADRQRGGAEQHADEQVCRRDGVGGVRSPLGARPGSAAAPGRISDWCGRGRPRSQGKKFHDSAPGKLRRRFHRWNLSRAFSVKSPYENKSFPPPHAFGDAASAGRAGSSAQDRRPGRGKLLRAEEFY